MKGKRQTKILRHPISFSSTFKMLSSSAFLSLPTQASHITGCSPISLCLRPEDPVEGGTHVPFWIASSMRRWCRLRRINDLITIAADTPSSKTRVAKDYGIMDMC